MVPSLTWGAAVRPWLRGQLQAVNSMQLQMGRRLLRDWPWPQASDVGGEFLRRTARLRLAWGENRTTPWSVRLGEVRCWAGHGP